MKNEKPTSESSKSNALDILKREARELRYMAAALEYRVMSMIAENKPPKD
tara:strand:- start:271 stop:420 length:150 start_codon:yes stop_codon:yes gene_type:complete